MRQIKWCQPWNWNMRGEFYFLECEPSLKIHDKLIGSYVCSQLSYMYRVCLIGILVEMAIAPLKSIRYWKSWGAEMHDKTQKYSKSVRKWLRKMKSWQPPPNLDQNSLHWIWPIFRGGCQRGSMFFRHLVCTNLLKSQKVFRQLLK